MCEKGKAGSMRWFCLLLAAPLLAGGVLDTAGPPSHHTSTGNQSQDDGRDGERYHWWDNDSTDQVIRTPRRRKGNRYRKGLVRETPFGSGRRCGVWWSVGGGHHAHCTSRLCVACFFRFLPHPFASIRSLGMAGIRCDVFGLPPLPIVPMLFSNRGDVPVFGCLPPRMPLLHDFLRKEGECRFSFRTGGAIHYDVGGRHVCLPEGWRGASCRCTDHRRTLFVSSSSPRRTLLSNGPRDAQGVVERVGEALRARGRRGCGAHSLRTRHPDKGEAFRTPSGRIVFGGCTSCFFFLFFMEGEANVSHTSTEE